MSTLSAINLAIFDFETALEDAFMSAIISDILPRVHKQGGSDKLLTPRVEVKFFLGQNEEQYYIVQSAVPPVTFPNLWSGIMGLKVVTNRVKEPNTPSHRQFVAAVRWLALDHKARISPRMPLHTLTYCRETGTNPGFAADEKHDMSALAFAIKINIKPSAFPTVTIP